MNRTEAKKIAETITMEQIREMFMKAQELIKDWTVPSNVNLGLSKGVAFNILSAGELKKKKEHMAKTTKKMHHMAKINAIREFGEYLPGYKKPVKVKTNDINVAHQEPKFIIP